MYLNKLLFAIVLLFCSIFLSSVAAKRGDESKYTKKEAAAIVSLRKAMGKELYADYMSRDEYLITWLRAKKLDVTKATEMLRTHLKWRKDENMDELANEDFPQFDGFLYDNVGKDKEGRPVAGFAYGASWDTRKATISGQMKSLIRYMIKNIFEVPQIRARREGQEDGTNATQSNMVVDLAGYNLKQHGCVRCFEIYMAYVVTYEAHYPQQLHRMLAINNPKIFDPVLTLVRPFFSEQFEKSLKMLGPNKDEWKAEMLKHIPASELPARFGGTSTRKMQSG